MVESGKDESLSKPKIQQTSLCVRSRVMEIGGLGLSRWEC